MNCLFLTFICLSVWFPLVRSLSPTYLACQLLKYAGESALTGCPNGTLYVSQTDPSANFSSVQEAISSLPQTDKHTVILIGQGQYFESINISLAAPLTLLGQLDPATASIRGANASQRNCVQIRNSRYAGDNVTDEQTATVTVAPTVGFSFGNVDFKAYNINFENSAANYSISQALVMSVVLANASFYGCTFASWQDTWFTGFEANTYVVDSIIYGQVDYLFGFGRAWFQSVTLANRAPGGSITAWAGTPGTTNGVYIVDSKIIRSPDSTGTTDGNCFLGRPWNEYARAIYLRNYMDDSIHSTGFTAWSGIGGTLAPTIYYAESGSHGPGGNTSARIKQEHILSAEEAQIYTLKYVFGSKPKWIEYRYQY